MPEARQGKTKTFHISDDLHYRIKVATALSGLRIEDFVNRALLHELEQVTENWGKLEALGKAVAPVMHGMAVEAAEVMARKRESVAQFDRQWAGMQPEGESDAEPE